MGMAMDHIIVVVMLLSATTIDNPVHAACNLRGGHQTTDHSSANDIFSLALRDESLLLGSQRRIQAIPADGQDGGEYIQQCESFLSDPNVADDGIISQIDFADMLLHQCHLDNLCPNKFTLKFEQLDVPLQLKFIKGICHHEELTDRFDCIRDLEDMWLEGDEFGFDADAEDVDDLVKDMCLETFVDAVEMGFAMTQAPTATPSTPLTQEPSPIPTNPPSSQPSRSSTMQPSAIPTSSPSMSPLSVAPTSPPTLKPSTNSPTASSSIIAMAVQDVPTDSPSDSIKPTSSPSTLSSSYPSSQPTSEQDIDRFADDCTSYLLSPDFLEDDIISQTEFTRFLIHHCIQKGLCDDRTVINFNELETPLQLEFILGVCSHEEQVGKAQCIDDLRAMWREGNQFGFDADAGDMELLVEDVREMCASSYGYVVEMGLAETPAPTMLRTVSPSVSPPATTERSNSPTVKFHSLTPNGMPSTFTAKDTGDGNLESPPSSPESEDSISRGAIIGMSFALALSLGAACVMYAHHRSGSGYFPAKYSKDPNHFGIAAHEPWGKSISSLPLSYMGLNCSLSSSSSSFRDYRFVNVFGPEGTPIPQFNPNTAGAVVIGSVTIGGSSSYSSGPFANTSYSAKSRSFFSIGKLSHRKEPTSESSISSKDGMSTLSSNRYSPRKNPKSYNQRRPKRSMRLGHSFPVGTQSIRSRSNVSRTTMPMNNRRRQKLEQRVDSHLSFGDWRAVSHMTEYRHTGQGATDASAAMQQSKFFFDALFCPDSPPSSDSNTIPKSMSCQSLPNVCYLARAGSSDAGVSSILSESFFQELFQQPSVTMSTGSTSSSCEKRTSENSFVPWRKEGFSASLQLSDSRQSVGSSTSSLESNVPHPKERLDIFRPAKALFAKCKKRTNVKGWCSFKHRQYKILNRENLALQEDHSVVSMKSYSSHVNLLPHHMAVVRADLPNMVLGTFAAASIPLGRQKSPRLSPNQPKASSPQINDGVKETIATASGANAKSESVQHKLAAAQQGPRIAPLLQPDTIAVEPLFSDRGKETIVEVVGGADITEFEESLLEVVSEYDIRKHPSNDTTDSKDIELEPAFDVPSFKNTTSPVTFHISSLDMNLSESFCAYSRSDFESSAPSRIIDWSESSCDSPGSSTDTSQSNSHNLVDSSFAAATAPLGGEQDEGMASSDEMEECAGDVSFLSNGTDANTTVEDEPKAVHLIGISNLLSDSESSEGSFVTASQGRSIEKSDSNGVDLNDTNIVSHSDSDQALFPSDEEDSMSHGENCCADLHEDTGCKTWKFEPETQGSTGEKSIIISNDIQKYDPPIVDGPGQQTIVWGGEHVTEDLVISDDTSLGAEPIDNVETDGVPSSDLFALEKGEGPGVLSISLSWESGEVSSSHSIGRISDARTVRK